MSFAEVEHGPGSVRRDGPAAGWFGAANRCHVGSAATPITYSSGSVALARHARAQAPQVRSSGSDDVQLPVVDRGLVWLRVSEAGGRLGSALGAPRTTSNQQRDER